MERLAFTRNNKLFKQLEDRVSYAALKREDRAVYDADLKAYRDIMGQLEYALNDGWHRGMEKGMAEGLEKGMAEGLEKGMAQGMAQGEQKMKIKMIKSMSEKGMDAVAIAAIADLPVPEIIQILSTT